MEFPDDRQFVKRKKNRPGFSQSEPESLISYMDRHRDWAAIICLVAGEEINTGEAGIGARLDAVMNHVGHWKMFISSRLHDSEYAAGAGGADSFAGGKHCKVELIIIN